MSLHDMNAQQSVAHSRLSHAQIAALAPLGTRWQLRDGEQPLPQAGKRRGGFFVGLSGAVDILDRSGEEPRTLHMHQPGELTGDIDILSRRRSIVTAVARGDTEAPHLPSAEIHQGVAEQPSLGELLLKAFIARRELVVMSGITALVSRLTSASVYRSGSNRLRASHV